MAMDKFAVEEREEDLGNGEKLIKRADGTAFVKTASGKHELDLFDDGQMMAKTASAPARDALERNGYVVR